MTTTFITCIYNNLYGTEFGGRINRTWHYKWGLLSLLKMDNAKFVCYTSGSEINDLENFFFEENGVNKNTLEIRIFELNNTKCKDLIDTYKNLEEVKKSDRCFEIQYMKFYWLLDEANNNLSQNYYWIDSGLSHCGLIPSKYLSLTGPHGRGYYESSLFNNTFLNNLVEYCEDKFLVIAKENSKNYWSGTVNPKYYTNYDSSLHIIGGLFGGNPNVVKKICSELIKSFYEVTEGEKIIYHEENILSLTFRNLQSDFKYLQFDTWWHEEERISGLDMIEHTKNNKSFYKILTELNGIVD